MKKMLREALAIMVLTTSLVAQTTKAQVKELSIGDRVPDVQMNNIVNYKSVSAKLSDFSGKLLILDFWATWCGPCIAEFPKLDSLQRLFGDQVQILSVTDQPAKTAQDFFARYKNIKNGAPRPSVTGDTTLKRLFKHSYIPHYVWIDRDGRVASITYASQITADNIRSFLAGKATAMPVKYDGIKPVIYANPVFEPNLQVYAKPGNDYELKPETLLGEDILEHATFTRNLPALVSFNRNDRSRITTINNTIENLYCIALGRFQWEYMYGNRSRWEVKNPALAAMSNDAYREAKTQQTGQKSWEKENTFCYELRVPATYDVHKKFDIMLQALNEYFGLTYNIEGVIEKRPVKCLALVRTSNADKISLKDSAKPKALVGGGAYKVQVVNYQVSDFINMLRNALQALPPVIDQTGYTGKVDIELEGDLSNVDALNELLAKYDLKFVEKETDLDTVIIKDKNKN